MPSMMRRMRTRLPTYLSTGLGALVDISDTPLGLRLQDEAKWKRSMPEAPIPSNLARRAGDCRQVEQQTDWVCSWQPEQNANGGRSVNWRNSVCRNFFRKQKENMNPQASETSLRNAPP